MHQTSNNSHRLNSEVNHEDSRRIVSININRLVDFCLLPLEEQKRISLPMKDRNLPQGMTFSISEAFSTSSTNSNVFPNSHDNEC